jgi:hypothetical protein
MDDLDDQGVGQQRVDDATIPNRTRQVRSLPRSFLLPGG